MLHETMEWTGMWPLHLAGNKTESPSMTQKKTSHWKWRKGSASSAMVHEK
jgi:hypothetical protein